MLRKSAFEPQQHKKKEENEFMLHKFLSADEVKEK